MREIRFLLLSVLFGLFLWGSVLAGMVNLNTAGKEELETLPGIGPKVAERIVEYREKFGPFKSVEELLEIKGIGPKKLQKIKPLVTVEVPES